MTESRYLRIFTACFLGGAAAVWLFTAVVDPFDVHRWMVRDGFNRLKTDEGSRIAKAIAVSTDPVDAIILGSSRAEVGLSPDHPGFAGLRTYNLALAGTNMAETYPVFEFARRHNRLRKVVLAADFLMFSDRRTTSGEYEASRFNAGRSFLEQFFQENLSLHGIRRALATLRANRKGTPSGYLRGHNPLEGSFSRKVAKIGHRAMFREALVENFLTNPETYGAYRYSPERVDLVRRMVGECRAGGIELVIVIPPVHVWDLETVRALGLWPQFEQWKEDLAGLLWDGAQPDSGGNIYGDQETALWDFTGYEGPASEEVPEAGDTRTRMEWFWEASHFRVGLGEMVLTRAVGPGPEPAVIPAGFGVLLNAENVWYDAGDLRKAREIWAAAHPADVAEIERLVQQTEPVRRRLRGGK